MVGEINLHAFKLKYSKSRGRTHKEWGTPVLRLTKENDPS